MRPLSEWNESDLQRLIDDDVQESLTLDYKRSDALSKSDDKKKIEITKDVSAFANSAGGRIIYGIVEKGHHPTEIDAGSDPKAITREWLEQVVNGIQPRIHGVVIKPIPLANRNNAFVVDIPMTQAGGPHQASDQRYYRRFNFQSVPMYHHEIMDVANRAASPLIEAEFSAVKWNVLADDIEVALAISLHNRSKQPATYGACSIYLDEDFNVQANALRDQWAYDQRVPRTAGGMESQFVRLSRRFTQQGDQPIYKEEPYLAGSVVVRMRLNTRYFLGWHFNAPGYSQTRWGVCQFHAGKGVSFHWFEAEAD